MADSDFRVVGRTEDGKLVVAGLFRMYDTCGLPLPDLFIQCEKHGMMPSWLHFVADALKAGWTAKTIRSRLEEAVFECYGLDFKTQWLEEFNQMFTKQDRI